MKISLISPKWDKMVLSYPPLGLAYLAAALERAGHTVRIHVFSLDPTSPLENDVEQVKSFNPDLVGISSMTNVYFSAQRTAELVKQSIGCWVVMGGPHATVFPERTADDPNVDFVVYGEGELTAVELVDALETGKGVEEIKGICFRRGDSVQRNEPRPLLRDLDSLPFPARHLLELDRFPLRAVNGQLMTTVLTSRGCPFDCSYCFKGMFGRTYRQRSPANVLAELEELVKSQGITNVYFVDDLFTASVKWLREFCNGIIDRGLDIRWQCLARVDTVTPELLDLMYRAGCREIHYGVEAGNEEVLHLVSKHISLDSVRQAVSWTKQAGMLTKGYFMLGLPSDTERSMKDTIRLACDLDLDEAMFSVTTPFPGTRLWQELTKKNPAIEFDRDFAQAYYFNVNSPRMVPFLNVSQVSDESLSRMASLAVRSFEERQRKKRYVAFFGNRIGVTLWTISRLRGIRRVGRTMQRLGLFRGLRNTNREIVKAWS